MHLLKGALYWPHGDATLELELDVGKLGNRGLLVPLHSLPTLLAALVAEGDFILPLAVSANAEVNARVLGLGAAGHYLHSSRGACSSSRPLASCAMYCRQRGH